MSRPISSMNDFELGVKKPRGRHSKPPLLTGQTFGRLRVIQVAELKPTHRYLCLCRCGQLTTVYGASLRRGATRSCGCFKQERDRDAKSHGLSRTPEYLIFKAAQNRCENPNVDHYESYGGRGIEFRFTSITELIDDIGMRPSKEYTLDRKNVNGHYEPGNVQWATFTEQANNKRNNVRLTLDGETKTVTEWAKELGRGSATIFWRHRQGWSDVEALTAPVNQKHTGRPKKNREI